MTQAVGWSSDQELGSCGSVSTVLDHCWIRIGRMVSICIISELFVCSLVFCQLVCAYFLAFGVSWSKDQELAVVTVLGQCRALIGRMMGTPSLSCLFACLLVVFYQLVCAKFGHLRVV